VLGWASATGLVALAALACRQWNSDRSHGRAALAGAFLALAATSLVSRAADLLGLPATFLAPVTIAAFELSGLCLLLFRSSFLPLSRLARVAAVAGVVASVLAVFVFGLPPLGVRPNVAQSATLALLVGVWTTCVAEPMVRFWRAAAGRPAVQRARLRALATAYAAILLVLLMAAGPQSVSTSRTVQLLSAVLGVAVVPLLYAGFDPPVWLRRLWRHREEDATRRGVRELVAFAEDERSMATRALEWGTRLVGAESGLVVADPGGILATLRLRDGDARELVTQIGALDRPRIVPLAHKSAFSAVVLPLQSSEASTALIVLAGPFTPLFGSDEVARLQEFAADVSVALDRVRQSLRHRSFLQAVSDMGEGLVITENGRAVYVNEAYAELTGYSIAELIALPTLLYLAPEESREELAARLANRIAGGEVPYQYEAELVRKDGRRVRVENAVRLLDGGGTTKIIAIVRDISERAQAQDALRASEARLQSIIDKALSAVVTMDAQGMITGWSTRAQTTFGWSYDEVVGRRLADTIVPVRYRAAHVRGLEHFLETGEGPVLGTVVEVSALHQDGHEFPVELAISPALSTGQEPFFVAFIRDVSERKHAEGIRAMQFAVTRVLGEAASLDEAAPDLLRIMAETLECEVGSLWLVNAGGGTVSMRHSWSAATLDGRAFANVSRAMPMTRGEGLPGRVWETAAPLAIANVSKDSNFPRAAAAGALDLRCAIGIPIFVDSEVTGVVEFFSRTIRRLDDDLLDIVTDLGRQIGQFIERRRAEAALRESMAQLAEVAATDPLTGVRNRREFERQLSTIPRRRFALLAIDVDNLKQVNDEFGHEAGDVLLRAVALTLASLIRGWDVVARVGGDEFAVLLLDADGADAAKTGERLRTAVHAISVPYGRAAISVGWASGPAGGDPHAIWRQADMDLYQAKRQGRDRVRGRHAGATQSVAHSDWAERVERTLIERSIAILYQPIVRLVDGRVVGHEALARPSGCGPSDSVEEFFAEAQRLGRVRDIDWLCRRKAVEGAVWPAPENWSLFINVRMVTLLDPVHGPDQLLLVLRAAGARPEQIVLELTEHEIVSDLDRLRLVLASYREHGFRFALDDVGDGHSTLELLAAANAEYIKIARSLTNTASRSGSRSAIHAAVAFAESSGATLLAEGLESDFAIQQMRDFGVALGQGWWLGRPGRLQHPRPAEIGVQLTS
jgi:diguanylate cyclase (GGDEF)-like protein/PAS domain S-box-containing protein